MRFRNDAGADAGVSFRAAWRIVVTALAVIAFWLVMSAASGVAAADQTDPSAQSTSDNPPVVIQQPDNWRSG